MKKILASILSLAMILSCLVTGGIMAVNAEQTLSGTVMDTELPNAGFEDGVGSATAKGTYGAIAIDSEDYSEGSQSLKITSTGSDSGANFGFTTNAGDLDNIDHNLTYKIRLKAKSTTDYSGYLALELTQWLGDTRLNDKTSFHSTSRYSTFFGVWGRSLTNSSQSVPTCLTEEWTTYESEEFTILGDKVLFTFHARASAGSVWVDDFELVACGDSSANHGKVETDWDSENDKLIVTVIPDNGYKVSTVKFVGYYISTSNAWKNEEMPYEEIVNANAGQKSYSLSLTRADANDGYDIYTNSNYKFLNISFADKTVVAILDNPSFETGNAPSANGTNKANVSIDTTTAAEGSCSIKVETTGTDSGSNFTVGVTSGAMDNLDVNVRYQLRISAKSTEDYSGYLYVSVAAEYNNTTLTNIRWGHPYRDGFAIFGYATDDPYLMTRADTCLTTDWQVYETAPFTLMGDSVNFTFVNRGTAGTVWFDNVELVAVDDSDNNHGTVTTAYDSTTGNIIVTAKADPGYQLSSLNVQAAPKESNRNSVVSLPLTKVENNTENETSYSFSFTNDGVTYEPYNHNVDLRLFKAVFSEVGVYDIFVNGGFENATITNASAGNGGVIAIDTDAYEGSQSLKVSSPSSHSGVNITLKSAQGALADMDVNVRYQLRYRTKATEDYTGCALFRAYAYYNGTKAATTIRYNSRYGDCFYSYGYEGTAVAKEALSTEWTTYYSEPFMIFGDQFEISFVTRGDAGAVWFDDFELVVVDDAEANHGKLTTSYDSESGKIIVTAKAAEGYKLNSFSLKGAVSAENQALVEIPGVTVVERPSVDEVSYSFSFVVDGKTYDPYNYVNGSNLIKLFNATFAEAEVTRAGDANLDDKFDVKDLVRTKKYLAKATFDIELINVDYDADGIVIATELATLRQKLLGK